MMSSGARPPSTLGGAPSRKRKERELSVPPPALRRQPGGKLGSAPGESAGGSRLLSGYLAHEYLTRGTLLGRPVGPPRRTEPETAREQKKPCEPAAVPAPEARTYAEVSRLLMMRADGVHVAGVVNPTQLAQWLRM